MTIERDEQLYRPCVGAIVLNADGQVWIGRRFDAPGDAEGRGTWWQMPQGGIDDEEDPAAAVLREVREETGMVSLMVEREIDGWHYYDLPDELLAKKVWGGKYRGQRQKWFILRFTGADNEVVLEPGPGLDPEFDSWRWARTDELMDLVVPFKAAVYRSVLEKAGFLSG